MGTVSRRATAKPVGWWRKHRRVIGMVWGGTSLLITVILVWAVFRRPAWYQPVQVDEVQLRSDKSDLSTLLDDIGAALNGNAGITVTLDEKQVNRWLAKRAEIWPEQQIELEGASDPQIQFLPGNRIQLAATTTRAGMPVVLSAEFRVEATPEHVRLYCEAVSAGRLSVPRGSLMRALGNALAASESGVSVSGDVIEMRNQWTWPNGERRFWIASLEMTRGAARVELRPGRGVP